MKFVRVRSSSVVVVVAVVVTPAFVVPLTSEPPCVCVCMSGVAGHHRDPVDLPDGSQMEVHQTYPHKPGLSPGSYSGIARAFSHWLVHTLMLVESNP